MKKESGVSHISSVIESAPVLYNQASVSKPAAEKPSTSLQPLPMKTMVVFCIFLFKKELFFRLYPPTWNYWRQKNKLLLGIKIVIWDKYYAVKNK